MANQKLTDLTSASTPLSGSEQVYVVQSGNSRKATAQQLADVPGEWSGETVSQAEAEAGIATTRRAWTAQRVFQAAAAWWAASAAKTKLDGIAAGAEVNVNADWNASSGDAQILNKPTLGTAAPLDVAATGDATSGQVVKGNDSRLSDSRTPTAHTQAASTISDSTAAGRALLTAADAAAQRTSLGLGTAATTAASDYATAAQGSKADTAVQPAGLSGYVQTGDSRLTDSREWSAATIDQAEAEAGTATTRRAFTAQRVFQAIAAWWAASAAKTKLDGIASGATANSSDATLLARVNHTGTQAGSTITGAYTAAGLTMATARLLGRGTAGTGAAEEISLGTNLSLSGTTLNAAAGSPGGSSGQLQWNSSGAFAGASTLTYDGSILTSSGRFINSYNATASSPAKAFTGTWFTGGTATTTKPHVLIEPTGTTSTAWSTSGTGLGVNAPSGFTGNLLDLQVNGTSRFKLIAGTGGTCGFAGNGSTVTGQGFAWTSGNASSANEGFAAGYNCKATGVYATAIGTNCTASGDTAFCIATGNSTASGNYSAVIGSTASTASGAYSGVFAGSYGSVANRGQVGHGIDRFAAAGDAQWSILGFRGSTSDATATEIFLDGQANTRATVPASTTWMADINVIARSSGGTDNACFKRRCIIKRDASNNTALVGSVLTVDTDIGSNSGAPPAGWAVTVTANDTNEALKIEVTGAAATNIRWVAKVDLVEVGFA